MQQPGAVSVAYLSTSVSKKPSIVESARQKGNRVELLVAVS